jgi:hypothetical protein
MDTTESFIEVPPDPKRVSEGLRDTGYQFHTAVADIIDNSIAAGATEVEVVVGMDMSGDIMLAVVDNGCGMDREGLINAMRYGSRRRADPGSLGKFGLGLKTASTAFCTRLSLITRDDAKHELRKATWDLDHIAKSGRWELLMREPTDEERQLMERVASGQSGTTVLWENVDRLVGEYASPGGKPARKALDRHVDQLRQHCAMTYQRFLDPADKRTRNLSLKINGEQVAAWDPFCVAETSKAALEKTQKVKLNDGTEASFTVRAFILPRKDEFKDAKLAKSARLSNDYQGIYVYRENRMIHGPDWMDMFRKEPHFTLLRVEFSFKHELDDAFHIDIKKSQILLNETIFEWLREKFLSAPRREAEQRYRHGAAAAAKGFSALLHAASNNAIHGKADALKTAKVKSIDEKTGEVTIVNKYGSAKLMLKLLDSTKAGELHVQPVDGLDDGVLWEPALIDGNQAVRINTKHPYYSKVFLPNRSSGVTIQGLDSLLWALCAAELGTVSDDTKRHFEELRFEVSRLLRRLVEDLPEPDLDDDNV